MLGRWSSSTPWLGLAWLVVLGLLLSSERFYFFRALGLLLLNFVFGVYFTARFGPFAAGPFWLFAGPMMAGAFFGSRIAVVALGCLALILVGISFLLSSGAVVWPAEIPLAMWLVLGASLVALSGTTSISVGLLLDGIAQASQDREEAREARGLIEEQLRQSQKLEAVGRLAGGIAHDFNNYLVAISGFAELAMRRAVDNAALQSDLSGIVKSVDRGKALTEQLLAFSRKSVVEPRVVDINQIIAGSNRLLAQLAGDRVRIVCEISPEPCRAKIDPDAFGQVLANATLNSRDAMPEGGTLTIRTRRAPAALGEGAERGAGLAGGDCIVLSITDTGLGIREADRDKLFEPFFTTKPAGRGLGLGLSTCWAIAQQAGGHIDIRSEVGAGTTFELYLPSVVSEVELPAVKIEVPTVGGHETILLVEDDEQVRKMFSRALEEAGYVVFQAGDGDEALARAGDRNIAIDLLLTDVILPGCNGREIASRVVEIRPEIPVLFVSGYSDDVLTRRGVLEGGMVLLKKPFGLADLASKVRSVLDEAARHRVVSAAPKLS